MKRFYNQHLFNLNTTLVSSSLEQTNPIFTHPVDKDYSFYSKVLHFCVERRAHREGKLVHSHIITNGFSSNPILSTKLVIFYSKTGDMVCSRKVFDEMPERSVVAWTALLSGYTHNGFPKEALLVFSKMRRVGIRANQFTYGSALRACTSTLCLNRGKQVQGCIEKSWLVNNLFVQSALVDLHSKCGNMVDACYVFESMSERDLVTWNAMLGGYAIQGCANEAFQLFASMLRGGLLPDSFTLGSAIKASSRANGLMKIIQIHVFIIKLPFEQHKVVAGSLIDAYVKCGKLGIAHRAYTSMSKRDPISCTALITGYAQKSINNRNAFYLFNEIRQLHLGVDNVMLCSMLNICAKGALLYSGKQIHALALKYEPNHDLAMSNALIDMYSKCGKIDDAKHVFSEMKKKNVISWTSLICGYGKHGCGYEAIDLYNKMENEGIKPNDVTFLSLLFACSHAGLTNEGCEHFDKMVNIYNIVPRSHHYSCMVDILARGGKINKAFDMIRELKIKPNASLWGSILGACSVYGDTSLGEIAGRHLLHSEPEMSVNYAVLGSIYAAAGLWDNVFKTRKLMEEKNLRKVPAYSLSQTTNERVLLLQPSGKC